MSYNDGIVVTLNDDILTCIHVNKALGIINQPNSAREKATYLDVVLVAKM